MKRVYLSVAIDIDDDDPVFKRPSAPDGACCRLCGRPCTELNILQWDKCTDGKCEVGAEERIKEA